MPQRLAQRIDELGYAAVGQRILRFRTVRGLTIRALANAAQLSKNTVTRIERGLPVHLSSIRLVCRALGIKAEVLLSADFELGLPYSVERIADVRWSDMIRFDIDGGKLAENGTGILNSGAVFAMLGSCDSGGKFNPSLVKLYRETPPRSHRGEEFVYVINGGVDIIFENKSISLGKGDSIFFWAAESHAYRPHSNTMPTELLCIVLDPQPTL
jgi:transcriptional regulator with XRE-family HTH domain